MYNPIDIYLYICIKSNSEDVQNHEANYITMYPHAVQKITHHKTHTEKKHVYTEQEGNLN